MRIELQHISRFFSESRVLNDVSLELSEGSKTALIGPNGSGKTTLVRIMLGLMRSQGMVLFDGEILKGSEPKFTRRVGYVPQVSPQLKAPVKDIVENICLARGASSDDVHELASALGLNLGAIAKQPFRSLSGGMRQKLVIALALFSKPEFLVMDEPTASLDSSSRQAFFGLLPHYTERSTVLLSSHRLDELTHLVDDIALLQQGEVVFSGSAAGFLDEHAVSIVELHVLDLGFDEWLKEQGFEAGAKRWWIRRVRQKDKIKVLSSTLAHLGDALLHLYVQDLESVELGNHQQGQATHETT